MDRKIGKRLSILMNHQIARANEKLKSIDLTYAQANVLLQLKVAKSLSQDDLCKRLLLDKARVSRLVKQLEEKDYINKNISTTDRRIFEISISDKGMMAIEDILEMLDECNEYILKGLSENEVNQLIMTLDKLVENVKEGD